jgi:hypothetical protein
MPLELPLAITLFQYHLMEIKKYGNTVIGFENNFGRSWRFLKVNTGHIKFNDLNIYNY